MEKIFGEKNSVAYNKKNTCRNFSTKKTTLYLDIRCEHMKKKVHKVIFCFIHPTWNISLSSFHHFSFSLMKDTHNSWKEEHLGYGEPHPCLMWWWTDSRNIAKCLCWVSMELSSNVQCITVTVRWQSVSKIRHCTKIYWYLTIQCHVFLAHK